MSQPDLFTPAYPVGAGSKVEGSLAGRLAQYFLARPNRWIDGMELASVAGSYAWRSRCSDLRKPPYSMVIENRQRRVHGHKADCQMWDFPTSECHCRGGTITKSEYRYVPSREVD
jgi:hypothetical protein